MTKSYRPILIIPTTPIEKTYDRISLGLIFGMVVLAIWGFFDLPEIIPIHWNIKGQADGFGKRYWIGLFPLISLLFYFGNNKITKIPHKYNYLKKITEENVEEEYIFGRKVIRITHLVSKIVFALLIYSTVRGALTSDKNMVLGVLILLIVLILCPIIYSIYIFWRNAKLT